jgi:hypothetical protein
VFSIADLIEMSAIDHINILFAIATWGKDSRNVMTLYAQLGNLYAQRVEFWTSVDREREFLLAQLYLKRAIELQRRFQQEDSLTVSLNDLAELYREMGRYAGSLGTNHPKTQGCRHSLETLRKQLEVPRSNWWQQLRQKIR